MLRILPKLTPVASFMRGPLFHRSLSRSYSLEPRREDPGLRQFMSKVFIRSGVGVAGTLGTACLLSTAAPTLLASNPFIFFGAGVVLSFGGIFGIHKIKPLLKTTHIGSEVVSYTENPPSRELSFAALIGGMGITMTPFVEIINSIDPMILPASIAITTLITTGCALYAQRCNDAKMMAWRGPLMIGLGTLVGMGILSLAVQYFVGPTMFSQVWTTIDIYGGIALFTALSIYDVHMAKKMYQEGQPDHLLCATSVYLDFMNLLIRIMEAMAKNKTK